MENQEQRIKYVTGKNFSTNSATGVYGGITATGHISMKFYLDRINIPDVADINVDAKGVAQESPNEDNSIVSVRELISGIVMDINMAKSFHDWLGSSWSGY